MPFRPLLLLGLAMAATAVPATSAIAQDKQLGFGVQAIGSDATRGYFFFRDAQPGQTLRGQVVVANTRGRTTEILVKAQDADTGGDGGIEFVDLRGGPGTWISPRRQLFELGPRESRRLEVVVQVPGDAKAGDHFGGIVLYDADDVRRLQKEQKGKGAVSLKFISRIGIPIRTRIAGDLNAKVELQNAKVDVTPASSGIIVTFANVGNVLIPKSTGQATVRQGDVELARQKIALTSFLPGTSVDVRIPFKGDPAEATYRIAGVLRPLFADVLRFDENVAFGSRETKELEKETGRAPVGSDGGGFPLWAIILLALLLLGILFALLRRRRDEEEESPAAPVAGAAASPAGRPSLSSASREDLAAVPGIGPRAADRIIEHREEFGRFTSFDELLRLEHFDRERVDRIAEHADL